MAETRRPELIGVNVVFMALVIVIISARIYIRLRMVEIRSRVSRSIGIDDCKSPPEQGY